MQFEDFLIKYYFSMKNMKESWFVRYQSSIDDIQVRILGSESSRFQVLGQCFISLSLSLVRGIRGLFILGPNFFLMNDYVIYSDSGHLVFFSIF